MNILSRVRSIIFFWFVGVLFMAGIIFFVNSQVKTEEQRILARKDLVVDLLELNALTTQYVAHSTFHDPIEWYQKVDEVSAAFSSDSYSLLLEKDFIEKATTTLDRLKALFVQFIALSSIEPVPFEHLDSDYYLVDELLLVSQEMNSNAFLLLDESQEKIQMLQRQILFFSFVFLFLLLLGVLIAGFSVLKGIGQPAMEMAKAKAKTEAILRGIGESLVVTDENGVIVLVNDAFEKRLGYKKHEVIGKKFVQLTPAFKCQKSKRVRVRYADRLITRALKEGVELHANLKDCLYFKARDKSFFPVSVKIAPIFLEKKLYGVVLVFSDISQEKIADQAKTEFISLASHQLQTPITSANWYLEMLMNGDVGKLSKEQKELFMEVYKSNLHMKDLVQALLNVSRIELSTFMVKPQSVDLVALVKSILTELKPKIKASKVNVVQKYAKKLPPISADPSLIRIVFQNLLSNAIKYTSNKGNVTIDLRLTKKGQRFGGHVIEQDGFLIQIADTGMGIPKDEQTHIFNKMYRASNAKERIESGTGLGLYLVKSIVETVGGHVWFKSKEKEGTTFFVFLLKEGMKQREGSRPLESF